MGVTHLLRSPPWGWKRYLRCQSRLAQRIVFFPRAARIATIARVTVICPFLYTSAHCVKFHCFLNIWMSRRCGHDQFFIPRQVQFLLCQSLKPRWRYAWIIGSIATQSEQFGAPDKVTKTGVFRHQQKLFLIAILCQRLILARPLRTRVSSPATGQIFYVEEKSPRVQQTNENPHTFGVLLGIWNI